MINKILGLNEAKNMFSGFNNTYLINIRILYVEIFLLYTYALYNEIVNKINGSSWTVCAVNMKRKKFSSMTHICQFNV